MNYKITPVLQGMRAQPLDGALFMYGTKPGDLYDIPYGFFLLEGEDGTKNLIDTGILSAAQCDEWNLPYRGADGTPTNVEALYNKTGVRGEEIENIIITHLHWDHCSDLQNFPNAKIFVQKKELHYFIAPQPAMRAGGCMWEQTNGPAWLPSLLRFEVVDGEGEILPGISAILTPGHTPGSQSLLVDTKDGKCLMIGDYVHVEKNLTECLAEGMFSSLAEWYETYPKVMSYYNRPDVTVLYAHQMDVYDKTYG